MLNGFRGGLVDRLARFGTDAAPHDAAEGEDSMPATLILVALASVATVLWVFGAWSAVVPADGLAALTAEAVPAALAAVAAPPAILWLALTVWTAAVTARRSERAMRAVLHHTRRSTEQSEVQVRTLLQMQEDSRRARMLEGLDEALADLRCSLALIAERTGLLSADDTELAWARTAAGDRWAFANAFLTPWAYQSDLPEILGERVAQAPEAAAALQTYLRRWRRLLAVLSENEADKLLRETLEDGPADRLYAFLLRVETAAVALMHDAAAGHGGGNNGSSGGPANGSGRSNGSGSGQRYVASGQEIAPEPRALLPEDDEAADVAPPVPPLFAGMATEAVADQAASGRTGGEPRPTVN